ncbi:Alpha/Beta hydrolase protein [Plectosphaerella plurivora]|uniref:Alpha/Beta hydrolase protein n=1 Tax=Plectosphaerella plurivora TaxID=936078 RepID=A0A9P9AFL1_9PEZI|nr:Alpha/Beta hydrolase protein [Plectosphaerella plurivora]
MGVASITEFGFRYRTANVNGVKYRYIRSEPESGKAVGTVFLVHGWPDMALGWRNQIPYLNSMGLRVIAMDMMGYGGTDAPEEPSFYTLKRAGDDIAGLAKHLGLSRIVLGGHDWGGAVVYRTALYHPDLIAAFFVLSTPFSPPALKFVDMPDAIPTLNYQRQFRTDAIQNYIGPGDAQNATRIRQVLNTIYSARLPNGLSAFNASGAGFDFDALDGVTTDSPLLSSEEMDFYVENYMNRPFNRTLNWYRTGEMNFADEREFVAGDVAFTDKFHQPALYIGGEKDTALPPILSTGMETYFDSLSRGLADGDHWIMWGKAEAVNGFIGNWLNASVLGNATFGLNLTTTIGC